MKAIDKIFGLPNWLFSDIDGLTDNLAAPIVVLSQWQKSKQINFPSQKAEMVRDMVSICEVVNATRFFSDLWRLYYNPSVVQNVKIANSGCKFLNYLASRRVFQWSSTSKGIIQNIESASGIIAAGAQVYESYKQSKSLLRRIADTSLLAFEVLKSPWFKRESDTLRLCALTVGVFAGLADETIAYLKK